MQIIDMHLSVQPWAQLKPRVFAHYNTAHTDFTATRELVDSPLKLLDYLDKLNIDKAALLGCVSPDVLGFDASVNDFVAEYARNAPERLIPFGSIHPRFCDDALAEFQRLRELGIHCLMLHPVLQYFKPNAYRQGFRELEKIYASAEREGMILMLHSGSSDIPGARNVYADPMPVDDIAVDFPRLKIILAQSGWPMFCKTAAFLAARHPNVYLDCSGIPPRSLLESLPALKSIATKMLWGSGWPWAASRAPEQQIKAFRELPLHESIQELLFFENAQALLLEAGATY